MFDNKKEVTNRGDYILVRPSVKIPIQ